MVAREDATKGSGGKEGQVASAELLLAVDVSREVPALGRRPGRPSDQQLLLWSPAVLLEIRSEP